jgi:uncharacterized protein YraI
MFPTLIGRPLRASLVALAVSLIGLVGSTESARALADSASGTVKTSGVPLTVRAAPGTGYDAWSKVSNGATVTILCQTRGSTVTGTFGQSNIWDMISTGGFVADAYVKTGSDGYVVNACAYAAKPPKTNPNSVDKAISYEFSRLRSTAWENWCMRFQAKAYGWSSSGFPTAQAAGDWMEAHHFLHSAGTPPRGALVWYKNSSNTGHVVVSLGEGKIIGTSVHGAIGVDSYRYRSGYRGWSIPYFPRAR